MTAAEARAVWQRTLNRCFVQEDAKRAPKLACCQSSSSSCKQADSCPSTAPDTQDHHMVGFTPFSRNPSYSNLPPDMRWWLQLQPSHGALKGFTHEQLNALEDEIESLKTCLQESSSKDSQVKLQQGDCSPVVGELEFQVPFSKTNQDFLGLTNIMKDYEILSKDAIESQNSKRSSDFSLDSEFPWVEGRQTDPWWRTTDKDELAYLVAQKSVDYIVNCDLPPPQKVRSKKDSHKCSDNLDCVGTTYLNWTHETRSLPHQTFNAHGSNDSGRMAVRSSALTDESSVQCGSSESSSTVVKDVVETRVSENDPSKAQLLEALCHSQTRAREAEEAAQRAYAEKEHVIKLFFRQASQLFAYKQWFRMLQLEALCVQISSNEQQTSTLFPSALPWTPLKGRKVMKNSQRGMKGKRGKPSRAQQEVTRYAFAFALGLSLVGAGLLLGWTVGWMLPF